MVFRRGGYPQKLPAAIFASVLAAHTAPAPVRVQPVGTTLTTIREQGCTAGAAICPATRADSLAEVIRAELGRDQA